MGPREVENSDNLFISGIKLWQANGIAWINAYNDFLKAWVDNIKLILINKPIQRQISSPLTPFLSKDLKNILGHIAEMSEANPANSVYDTAIITQSGLSKEDVYNCLDQLERLNLIKTNAKESGETFRTINITQKGVENSSWSEIHNLH
jgi:DNA-binding MarR family transcriptional regulator